MRGTFLSDIRRNRDRLENDFMDGCWDKPEMKTILKNMVRAENDYRSAPGRSFVNYHPSDTGLANRSLIESVMPPIVKDIIDSFMDAPMPESFGCENCEKYYIEMKKYRDLLLLTLGVALVVYGVSKWKEE